jgi:hypothetical protein
MASSHDVFFFRVPFSLFTVSAAVQLTGRSRFSPLHWLLFTALTVCVLLAGSTYYGMLDEVNSQQLKTGKGKQFSSWQRDPLTFYTVLRIHRHLHPGSRARFICVAALVGMVTMGVTLVSLGL